MTLIFWKALAAIDFAILSGYGWTVLARRQKLEAVDGIFVPTSLVGFTSLIAYAFGLHFLSPSIWRAIVPLFLATSAFEIASVARKPATNAGALAGLAIATLIVGFSAVAMYRLGGSRWLGF